MENEGKQNKFHQILALTRGRKIVSTRNVYEKHNIKNFVKTFIKKSHGDTKRKCVV